MMEIHQLPIFAWAWEGDAGDVETVNEGEELMEWEFDIGDRVIATPDTDLYQFPGTVVRVYEKFGDCGRRYGVRLDAQDTEYFMAPVRNLRFVFGFWQLRLVPPKGS